MGWFSTPKGSEKVRVAIVHHWFVTRGGGERVAECIAELFPSAEIFTLLAAPPGIPDGLQRKNIHQSFLRRIPFGARIHRHLLPLYPAATRSLDLRGFELILSSDSGPVKGIRIDPGAVHICYCHSPMRYLYDGYESYRSQMGVVTRAIFTAVASRVRRWDERAATKVTHFVANSDYVAARIRRFYGRDSVVINPPIDTNRGVIAKYPGPHYLCAGRLVGYKRTDILIKACVRLGRSLRIVGSGPETAKLERLLADSKTDRITLLGGITTEGLWREYSQCRALLFAADEDFGMVPLEVQASGRPVIAYGKGGSLETVCNTGPFPTGVFFMEQTVEAVMDAILRFEKEDDLGAFDPETTRAWAEQFAAPLFMRRFREFVKTKFPKIGETG